MGRKVELWDKTYKCGELEVSGHIDGLFTWDEAMSLKLPEGWRVASDEDWFRIADYFANDAGKIIKGLEIELAGFRHPDGRLLHCGANANLWSSSESGADAWYLLLFPRYSTVSRDAYPLAFGFSVRCVRDIKEEEVKI